MAWKKLEESEYETYLDTLSRGLKDSSAEIEVMAVGIMDKQQTGWIPFYGISYDPREKIISISSEYIDHHIKRPREVRLHAGDKGVDSIEITGGDGYNHLLKLKQPIPC